LIFGKETEVKTALIIGGSVVGLVFTAVGFYKWGKHNGIKEAGVDPAEHKEHQRRKREEARNAA